MTGDIGLQGVDEYQMAMLNGGHGLTVVVALVALDRRGLLDVGDGLLRQLADAGELELETATVEDVNRLGVALRVSLRDGCKRPSSLMSCTRRVDA